MFTIDTINYPLFHMQFQLRLEQLVRTCAEHPKLAALQDILLRHFHSAPAVVDEQGNAVAGAEPSRAIIFTNLRESVATICALLRRHEPLIKAKYCPLACTLLAPLPGASFVWQ